MGEVWTPQRAANHLVRLVEAFSSAHGVDRFPVEISPLALDAARIFGWDDPITKVQSANIKGFDGALFPGEGKKEWLLLYNSEISSTGHGQAIRLPRLEHSSGLVTTSFLFQMDRWHVTKLLHTTGRG